MSGKLLWVGGEWHCIVGVGEARCSGAVTGCLRTLPSVMLTVVTVDTDSNSNNNNDNNNMHNTFRMVRRFSAELLFGLLSQAANLLCKCVLYCTVLLPQGVNTIAV